MPTSSVSLSDCIAAVVHSWQRQGIAGPPTSLVFIRQVAASNGVRLPTDFEQLYCAANGTPELYPNYLDEFGCSFLPVEYLRARQQEWLIITAEAATQEQVTVVPFIDYMHLSWEYGFVFSAAKANYQIGIMAGNSEFKVLTTSLAEFLNWYLTDAEELYNWNNPFSALSCSSRR